jgi:hypothetical protein
MRKMSRRTVTVGAIVGVLTASGIAWAKWDTTAVGSAGTRSGNAQPIEVRSGATVTSKLVPGKAGDVAIVVHNPNSYRVRVSRVELIGPIVADQAHRDSGCLVTGVRFPLRPISTSLPNRKAVDWLLEPGATTQFTMQGEAHMDNTSADACQNATFSIPVALTAESA